MAIETPQSVLLRSSSSVINDMKHPPVPASQEILPSVVQTCAINDAILELGDGSAFKGTSFGAQGKSVAGECVFQTGMVGYTQSLTDPSYHGQILIMTYPLIGNYGVPMRPSDLLETLPVEFESSRIHVAALVVGYYSEEYSHYLASSSLGAWLKENGVPAICGVDTRAMTKKIRDKGSMLGKLLARKPNNSNRAAEIHQPSHDNFPHFLECWREEYFDLPFYNPNTRNIVSRVSISKPRIYKPTGNIRLHPSGRPLRVLAVDVGMKYNQIRCFISRGVELKMVPWDYDFLQSSEEPYDGLFISNGPGNPTMVSSTIDRLKLVLVDSNIKPIFGICLGHQLLALAAGASTSKMKYGNRGHNIPCIEASSRRCYITSQNHGFQVDTQSLPRGWKEFFQNANDGSNEGIYCVDKPFFSVQFHPESAPGPRDTEFLFDVFIQNIIDCVQTSTFHPITLSLPTMPSEDTRIKVSKILILGSGGISIGQAGEFDYSGSQAIKALTEEGIYTVLINPNIATIATSKGLADKVYFLPVTPEFVRKIIKYEKPDGIYVTFGGQTALNVGVKLRDEFASLGCKVLGTSIETIIATEDRHLFASSMAEIGERCANSAAATTIDEAVAIAKRIGYPVILRAAYSLGGLGSGFAQDEGQLKDLCCRALVNSPQVLVEKSMKGWKEIEYEVVRDCRDNCITVCNMENFDPLGIHTGDSIVVAPSQTLSDTDYNMLRTTAINVVRHLGIIGECNIQYALNPESQEYCIIEVNARLSRSSALASKATGYPLAFVSAKLGLGIPLNEIRNTVTRVTSACFEPSLDYVVVKMPRWDLKKFKGVSTLLGPGMKSIGEVMSIGRTFEEAIQKAIRSIDDQLDGFSKNEFVQDIDQELQNPTDKRIFAIAAAFNRGYTVDKIWEMTKIDKWFLTRLHYLSRMERFLSEFCPAAISVDLLLQAKRYGFSDRQLAGYLGSTELAVRRMRQEHRIVPFVKQIDTVAAEFPAFTNYLYTTYNAVEHDVTFDDCGVMVLGSGVYRIGSSVEFDWCAVRTVRTLRDQGFKTVMVNYNPETVSTDYDEADRLYFEHISLETILDIYHAERAKGVILSMGGQTSNNISLPLYRQNVKIFGTSPLMIDTAENRSKFCILLDKLGIDQPLWKELTSFEDTRSFCSTVGYPVLVRPSYVLSGAAMNVVWSPDDLHIYLTQASAVSRDHPVVITKYLTNAQEVEVDAVAKDGQLVMHYISEHVENAGVHSGDATLILPPQDLDPEIMRRIEDATTKIAKALNVTGPLNIQFIVKNHDIKVIECNLRASRSFPFVSKVTGVDAIEMATKVMLGMQVYPYPNARSPVDYVGVKVAQFSFNRLPGADPVLGVEMASTGEVACFGSNKHEAYLKAIISSGITLPEKNILLWIESFHDKMELLPSVQRLAAAGYNLFATGDTAQFFTAQHVPCEYLDLLPERKNQTSNSSLKQQFARKLIDLSINIPSTLHSSLSTSCVGEGYRARRMAIDFAVPLITNVKVAKLLLEALVKNLPLDVSDLDYKTSHTRHTFPCLVSVCAFVPHLVGKPVTDFTEASKAWVSAGLTTALITPRGMQGAIVDESSLRRVRTDVTGATYCNYALGIYATSTNANSLKNKALLAEIKFLFISLDKSLTRVMLDYVSSAAAHFAVWPVDKPIITDAKGPDLATVLLFAALYNRILHVTDVSNKEDLHLILSSKQKHLKVTCDVAVFSLFFSREDWNDAPCLPSRADQEAIWKNLDVIDMFSVGDIPYRLAVHLGKRVSPWSGVEETLPLLLSAVSDGRLTLDDIKTRLHDNPIKIFALADQTHTQIEIVLGKKVPFRKNATCWSPLESTNVTGFVNRVLIENQTAYMDGAIMISASGRDVSRTPLVAKRRLERRNSLVPPGSTAFGVENGISTHGTTNTHSTLACFAKARSLYPYTFVTVPFHPAFHRRNILSVKQFSSEDIAHLFSIANQMKLHVERNGTIEILRGRLLCTMFYEPSTRTSSSFDAAMKRCGGEVVQIVADRSSVSKGESLADTVRTLGCYVDAIVLRHPDVGSAQTAADFSPVPIINAGDGVGEHPTQALLDVYTMCSELGNIKGRTITMLGDLKNGRTVHSLVTLLSLYSVHLNLVSPPGLGMPTKDVEAVRRAGVTVHVCQDLEEVLSSTDVLYVTRVQRERFENEGEWARVKDAYRVDNSVLARAKPEMIVMHPLPRLTEIDPEIDADTRRAVYFRQMRYGLFVRMALLASIMTWTSGQ